MSVHRPKNERARFRRGSVNHKGELCPYCALPMDEWAGRPVSADHVVPVSRRGSNKPENRLFVCKPCNVDKDDMTLSEFYDHLVRTGDVRARHVKRLLDEGRAGCAVYVFSPYPSLYWDVSSGRPARSLDDFRRIAAYLKRRATRSNADDQ